MISIAVFISGRGSNLKALWESVEDGRIPNAGISVVFSNRCDAAGIAFARSRGIPVVCLESAGRTDREEYDGEVEEALRPYRPDLICLAGYMRILTDRLIAPYKNRIMNVHPALLPSFPGLNAQKQALDYGVRFSGCTVHFVDGGTDTGPVILQAVVPVYRDDTEDTLSARILTEEHRIYPEAVRLYAENRLTIKDRRVLIKDYIS